MEHNPILNSPYPELNLHFVTMATGEEKGSLEYTLIVEGRRIFDHQQWHFVEIANVIRNQRRDKIENINL